MGAIAFFIDRSLGNHHVPDGLRAAGWTVITMRERYGERSAQALADVDRIRDSAEMGEVLLTGDKAIARRPLEAAAVCRSGARVFALGSNQLTGVEKAERFIEHERSILRRVDRQTGPYVVSVTGRGLETLLPRG